MPASIFAGSAVKALKKILSLNGGAEIHSTTVDPTASAVSAPIGSLLLNELSGKHYKKLDAGSSTNWKELGVGTGGINFITNSDIEVGVTGYSAYADAAATSPADGTGGSPNVTVASTGTTPLEGNTSLLFSKDAANRQGQGFSYDFTIAKQYKGQICDVSFFYEIASGTYADGDVKVYLYDVTNARVIEPAPTQILNVGVPSKWVGKFQTSIDSTSYRLIFHVASTSASAYALKIDTISVGPQSVAYGTTVTDWQTYTPTYTGFGTVTPSSMFWRRVGDSVQLLGTFTIGTATAVEAQMTLPSGMVIDPVKISSLRLVGEALPSGTPGNVYFILAKTGGVNYVNFSRGIAGNDGTVVTNGNTIVANGGVIEIKATIPIAGWSSNVVVSDSADTRVVAARVSRSTTQSINTASTTTVVFTTADSDTHAAYSTSTGLYTVPVGGFYSVSSVIEFASNSTGARRIDVVRGGSASVTQTLTLRPATSGDVTIINGTSAPIYCNAGDTLQIQCFQNSGGSLNIAPDGVQYNWASFNRISGPAQIAASSIVAAKLSSYSAAQTLSTSVTKLTFSTVDFDTNSAVSSSRFTAPVAGIYDFSALMQIYGQVSSVDNGLSFYLYKNGSSLAMLNRYDAQVASTNFVVTLSGSCLDRAIVGDYYEIWAVRDSVFSSGATLTTGSANGYFLIKKIGGVV